VPGVPRGPFPVYQCPLVVSSSLGLAIQRPSGFLPLLLGLLSALHRSIGPSAKWIRLYVILLFSTSDHHSPRVDLKHPTAERIRPDRQILSTHDHTANNHHSLHVDFKHPPVERIWPDRQILSTHDHTANNHHSPHVDFKHPPVERIRPDRHIQLMTTANDRQIHSTLDHTVNSWFLLDGNLHLPLVM
jgi:hypothetical protein